MKLLRKLNIQTEDRVDTILYFYSTSNAYLTNVNNDVLNYYFIEEM